MGRWVPVIYNKQIILIIYKINYIIISRVQEISQSF